MANKVTDEEIIRINELYLELGVKARVAEIVGRTPATVSKYIIAGYVSQKEKKEVPPFDMSLIKNLVFGSFKEFADACVLTDEEWAEMKEMQKEVFV